MGKEKLKAPTVMEEIQRRKEIYKKSEEFKKKIFGVDIPRVVRAC